MSTWFDFLIDGLIDRGWEQSAIDTCLFTKYGIIIVVYVDNLILLSPSKARTQYKIKYLQ